MKEKTVHSLIKRIKKKVPGFIFISFSSVPQMKRYNFFYRQKNKPTDVLSVRTQVSGEIFLCVSYIRKQAKDNQVPFLEELHRLLIHGLLHLSGYDHGSVTSAKKMFQLQEKLVGQIGFTPREWQKWVIPSKPAKRGKGSKSK